MTYNFLKIYITSLFLPCLLLCCELISGALPLSFQNLLEKNTKKSIVVNKFHTINEHENNIIPRKLKDKLKKNSFAVAQVSNGSSPWSNAVNFSKNWGTQVDPRTGTFTAYVKVGSMISNLDHGPNINLQISYNSDSVANPDTLGTGWSWNLTHFNPVTNQLSTSQGKTFNLRQQANGTWWPRYHKLHDIQIDGSKDTFFTITYANGLREILNHDGFEIRLEQQDGLSVYFDYVPGTHLLSDIHDDQGHKIILTRQGGFVTVTSFDADGKPLNIVLNDLDGQLKNITLPGKDKQTMLNIHMIYQGHLLDNIIYPTGLKKRITYNCTDAMPVVFPYGNQRHLCVVTAESTDPGAKQPEMITHYSYSERNANEHNYLGFNSGLSTIPGLSTDILFEAPADYTYKTARDNGLTTQIRTYNKYHLLISVKLISDRTGHLLSATHYFFCRTDKIDSCVHTSFEDLPDTYSLPLKIVTKIWGEHTGAPALETTENSYDNLGRITSTKDSYGREKIITYCPASGNAACPAEPDNWSLTTLVQSVTTKPSEQFKTVSEKPLVIDNFYKKEPNITGDDYTLVLASEVVKSGNQQITTTRQYYNDPKNTFEYGLLKTKNLTSNLSSDKTLTSVSKNYYYILSKDHATKSTYNMVKISDNQFKRSPMVTTSLFTNQVLESADPENKNIIHYHYDHWGRIIQEDTGIGTAFAVSKRYQYKISPQKIMLTVTASNGLQKKVLFDGTGRQLENFREAISATGKAEPGNWLPEKRITYDSYGRIAAEHIYYIDTSGHTQQLTKTFVYDDMGRVTAVHLPDKETAVKEYDDPDRCMVTFKYNRNQVHSAISITHSNLLDKPIKQILLPTSFSPDQPVSASTLCKLKDIPSTAKVSSAVYDGFGSVIKAIDPMGQIVRKNYNALGQVTDIIDPIGDKIHNVYNLIGQVVQKWIIPVNKSGQQKKQYLLASAQYNAAGELLWKAGEDGKKTWYTYTQDDQKATMTTPAGHVISWQYNEIGLVVSEAVDGKQLSHLDYDPVTALPTRKMDITGTITWLYSDDGKTQQLSHAGINGYPDYSFKWKYDQNRREISVTGPEGNQRSTEYDALGRISSISYHEANGQIERVFTPVYDGFSRMITATYGSGMKRSINYNDYGSIKSVSDTLDGNPLSAWMYEYNKEGDITSLVYNAEKNQQAVLHYQYDALNNLTEMTCSGSAGLTLCPRDTALHGSDLKEDPIITRQNYSFNNLNRIALAKETLLSADSKETLSKVVNYSYGNAKDPLRLQKITTMWDNKTPQTNTFTYDPVGNMVIDSTDNHIAYNAFNQITSVINPQGKQTRYFYDGSEREVREEAATGDNRNLIYKGKTLVGEKISNPQQKKHMISYLGIAKAIDGVIHDYYEEDYKGDVTGVLTKTANDDYSLSQRNVYSPYGMVWHTHSDASLPWYQQTLIGFNGEPTDPATGWQFLGTGHRTYNPSQRYFVSEDPAGDGYAFGSNNPIMNTDPSGNFPKWMGGIMQILRHVGTLGLDHFHKKWANIIGVTAVIAIACVAIAASIVAGSEVTPMLAAAMGLTVAAGGMAIASAAIPTNRGLSIASMAVGLLAAVVDIAATAGAAVFEGLQGAFFADDEAMFDDLVSEDLTKATLVNIAADDAINLAKDSNGAAAGADVAEADNSAANIDHAVYKPGRTYNLLTKELAGFTEEYKGHLWLLIHDNETFKTVWNKIINIGVGVKNNTDKLFLLLAQMRSVNDEKWSLEWLADYLDAKEYGMVQPHFQAMVDLERYFTESPYLIRNDFNLPIYVARYNQMLILPSEDHPYYTYGSQVNHYEWEIIHVDKNNQLSLGIFNYSKARDLIMNNDIYRFLNS